MRRADISPDAAHILPLAVTIPAISVAPTPATIGECNCAAYCGIDPADFPRLAGAMASDPAHRSDVSLICGRPKRYVVATAAFLAFLRKHYAIPVASQAPANDSPEPIDEAEAEAERLLAEVGALPVARAAKGGR